jgi:hypothetical protein
MKLIGTLQGVCAVKFSSEEVMPATGVQLPKIPPLIHRTYGASPAPAMLSKPPSPGEAIPPMNFVNGNFTHGETNYSVAQLLLANNGLMVTSQTTSNAEEVARHLMTLLDSQLGFRLADAEKRTFFVSALVVKFERSFDDLKALWAIGQIIQRAMAKDNFAWKRMSFGSQKDGPLFVSLDNLEDAEFVIERRAGSPFSDNRYFTVAPVTTETHLKILASIEDVLKEF